MKPKKILIALKWLHHFQYLTDLTCHISDKKAFDLCIVSDNPDIRRTVHLRFPEKNISFYPEFDPTVLDCEKPDLILCCEIWWWFKEILITARTRNIPILMYDHGTLIEKCGYILDGDEIEGSYRSDLALCSHVACWGKRGKDCWLSYGIPEEKLHVTGALQYDPLYSGDDTPHDIYDSLAINHQKRILLLFTCLHVREDYVLDPMMNAIDKLESFVRKNSAEYQLIVRPHPEEFSYFEVPPYQFGSDTIIIGDRNEKVWKQARTVDLFQVIKSAFGIVSYDSSVLVGLFILKKPITFVDIDSPHFNGFMAFTKNKFMRLKKNVAIESMIQKIEKGLNECELLLYDTIARSLNYDHDGGALKRLLKLINSIFEDQDKGKVFFPKSIQEEYMDCVAVKPDIPYAYQNLIKNAIENDESKNVEKWSAAYLKRFKNPAEFIFALSKYYFKKEEYLKVIQWLVSYKAEYGLNEFSMLRLAVSYRMLGAIEEAFDICNEILARKGINQDIRHEALAELTFIENHIFASGASLA